MFFNKLKFSSLTAAFLVLLIFCANVAMPGFWNVGGGATFIPYFAKDSVHLNKIQMKSELIKILLFNSFAVVKGEYTMQNLSDSLIQLNTGYPVNVSLRHQRTFSVSFKELNALKIKVNGREIPFRYLSSDSAIAVANPEYILDRNNWYVWQADYQAGKETKFEVYFMVNTNHASLLRGYDRDHHNGFLYILESGRAWAKSIENGRIFIQLKNELKAKDLIGVNPSRKFKINEVKGQMVYDFTNLESDSSSNVLLRYARNDKNFDYQTQLKKAANFYKELDQLEAAGISTQGWKTLEADDFEVHNSGGSWMVGLIFFSIFIGIPLLLILAVVLLFVFLRKRYLKKKNKSD